MESNRKKMILYLQLISSFFFLISCVILKVRPTQLIGAAFCHQIPSRSPKYDFPFCYRCSGLFFGILFGYIISLFTKKKKHLFPKTDIILFFLSFILFSTDILNSSKIPDVHLYNESIEFRMLSSFPLGYFLSTIICNLLAFWNIMPISIPQKKVYDIPCFFICGLISYYLTFNNNYFLSLFSRIIISLGAILFLSSLYVLLIFSIKSLRNRNIHVASALQAGFSFAILQVTLFGFLHLRYIHFEQIFT